MWKKIINGCQINLKTIFRNKLVWIFSTLYMFYLSYYFIIYYKYCYPEEIPIFISKSSIGCIILFIFIGYYLGKNEKNNGCEEILSTVENGEILKFISKMLSGFLLVTVFSTIIIIGLFVCYYIKHMDRFVYIQTLVYIFRYYILCITVFFIIGIIIGEKIQSKLAYILIFLIWIVFTPMNHYLFMAIQGFLYKEVIGIGYILNIFAPIPMYTNYNGIYGLPNQGYNLVKIILVILLLGFTINLLYLRKSKKTFRAINILLFIAMIPALTYMIQSFEKIWVQAAYMGGDFVRDINYYVDEENNLSKNLDLFDKYTIEACNAKLKIDTNFNFDTNIDVKFEENSDKLTFILYHGFKVKDIKDEDNSILQFTQNGDLINIQFKKEYRKNDLAKLKFSYGGYTASEFYIEKDAIYLPPYFPYLPSNVIEQPMKICNYYGYAWNELNYNSNYTLAVETDKKVYSNLDEISNNCFEGIGKKGVLLLSGDVLKEGSYKGIKYYYSSVKNEEDFKNCFEKYFNAIDNVNRAFNLNVSKNIEKAFFPDLNNWNFPSITKIYDNALISQVNEGAPIVLENLLFKDLLKIQLYRPSPSLEYLFIESLFLDAADNIFYNTRSLEINSNQDIIYDEENIDDKMYKEILVYGSKRVLSFYHKATEEEKINFIREFYNLLKNDKEMNREKLDQFFLSTFK